MPSLPVRGNPWLGRITLARSKDTEPGLVLAHSINKLDCLSGKSASTMSAWHSTGETAPFSIPNLIDNSARYLSTDDSTSLNLSGAAQTVGAGTGSARRRRRPDLLERHPVNRQANYFRAGIVALVLVGLLIVVGFRGCSSDLEYISRCGAFEFPEGVELVDFRKEDYWNDQVVAAVVSIPADKVESFKEEIGQEKFAAGVPNDWKEYWHGMKGTERLDRPDGNQYTPEELPSVHNLVIHDSGMVFIDAVC